MTARRPGELDRQVTDDPAADAERCLLGLAMLGLDEAREVVASVQVADIADPRHVVIYDALVAQVEAGRATAPLVLAAELGPRRLAEIGGHATLLNALAEADVLGVRACIADLAEIVRAAARRRRMAVAAGALAAAAASGGDDLHAVAELVRELLDEGDDGRRHDPYPVASWSDLAGAAPMEWIAPRWIPERSIGFLLGYPSSGKTFVALDLAARMATGRDWLGCSLRPGPVLYMCGEGHHGAGGRLAAWICEHGRPDGSHPLDVVDGVPPLTPAHAGDYRRLVAAFARRHGVPPQMVWLDTWAQALPGGENDDAVVLPALRIMGDLRREFDCSVWALAHPRKLEAGAAPRPLTADDLRGHGALRGNVDGVIGIDDLPTGRSLKVLKTKEGAFPAPIPFELRAVETGRHLRDGSPETSCIVVRAAQVEEPTAEQQEQREAEAQAQRLAVLEDRIVDELRRLGTARSANAVVAAVTGNRSLKFAAWARAQASGKIVQAGTSREPVFRVADTDDGSSRVCAARKDQRRVGEPGTDPGPSPVLGGSEEPRGTARNRGT